MRKLSWLTLFAAAWLVSEVASAAVPLRLPIQGMLRDNAGGPVTGDFALTVALYDAPDADVPVWVDTWPADGGDCSQGAAGCVAVTEGVFRLELGSGAALDAAMFHSPSLWLGLRVESEPELARRPLGSTPYAFHAGSAASVACTGCIPQDALDPAAVQAIVDQATAAVGEATEITEDMLPAMGLNEVSNQLLTTQFTDTFAAPDSVVILDYFPPGVTSTIEVPELGTIEALVATVTLTNSDVGTLTVTLTAPDGTEYVLFEQNAVGGSIEASFPPEVTLTGELNEWVGQSPAGTWRLHVVDDGFLDDGLEEDGAIGLWSMSFDTNSNQKVAAQGDLIVEGDLTVTGSVSGPGGFVVGEGGGVCDADHGGAIRYQSSDGRIYLCNGSEWMQLMACSTTCPAPTDISCGEPVAGQCGNDCGQVGSGLNSLQCLTNTQSVFCGDPVSDGCGNDCGLTGTAFDNAICAPAGETPCGTVGSDTCGNNCGVVGTQCPGDETCNNGDCVSLGVDPGSPATSCKEIHEAAPNLPNGLYWLKTNGGSGQLFQAYCDMQTDGGGFTLALVQPVGTNWGCLTPGQPPTNQDSTATEVLHHEDFDAMGAQEMYVAESGGGRVLKFYYPRDGVSWLLNYRYFTERGCAPGNHYTGDGPHTGGAREGNGHVDDACSTGNYNGWKQQNDCHRDSTNSHPSWGNGPGNGTSYGDGAQCWFFGGSNMSSVSSLSTCPENAKAPWGNYSTGNLSGVIRRWVR